MYGNKAYAALKAQPEPMTTVFVNETPSSSVPVGDQAALDAQNRIIAGKGLPGDRGLIDRHRQEQNTPATSAPASTSTVSDRNPDGSLKLAARTLGRYIGVTRPMAAARQMPHPHEIGPYHGVAKVEVVKSNLDPAHQQLADAMNAVSAGTKAVAKLPSLHHPLGVTPSLYQAYDQRRSAQHSAAVHQDIKIHGVQSPHDIGSHLKVHAKRGIQDAIRTMQGQSS